MNAVIDTLDAHPHAAWVCWMLSRILRYHTKGRFRVYEARQHRHRPSPGLTDHRMLMQILQDTKCCPVEFTGDLFVADITGLQASIELRTFLALRGNESAPHWKAA